MRHLTAAVLATGLLCAPALGADKSPQPQKLADLPANTWVQLPGGPAGAFAEPVYDPNGKRLLCPAGNGMAALDPATGKWEVLLAPEGGSTAGDQPLMKHCVLGKNGRPTLKHPLYYSMTTWDSKRNQLVAGLAGVMLRYDPSANAWADMEATFELEGATKPLPGVPPVAWGSMCYDPVNDEIIMLPGGAVYDWQHWEADKEVTGTFGTCIYSYKTNTWTRPKLGPREVHQARALLREARIALQDLMSATGEAIVLQREGNADESKKQLAEVAGVQKPVQAKLAGLARKVEGLGDEPRLAAAAGKIARAAQLLTREAQSADDAYRAQFEAYTLLVSARDEDLWVAPPPRSLAPMVYSPKHKAILLFGGSDGNQWFNDTWLYDCTTRAWRKMNPPARPRGREMHVLAWNDKLGKAVMAGGYISFWAYDKEALKEVWTYDPSADRWELVLKDFPYRRGSKSYFGAYSPADDALVVLRDGGAATFALKLQPGEPLEAPPADPAPGPDDAEPFLPPTDDPAVLARWKDLPANQWVAANAEGPEAPDHGWGMIGYNGRLNATIHWGGGHSTHQANEITLYFPGANRWERVYQAHRINLAPWYKACGNPGGVDPRGGVYNLHARRGLAGNGGTTLITIQCFAPYWYGPQAFLDTPAGWGKTTTFEFDIFAHRWRMPLPKTVANGMCWPHNGRRTVASVNTNGAWVWDDKAGEWTPLAEAKCPAAVNTGEGASQVYSEKRNAVLVVGPVGKEGIQTWMLDVASGEWKQLAKDSAPAGRPSGLVYVDSQDALLATCFLGWEKNPGKPAHWVYSFAHDAWRPLEMESGPKNYHSAWSKLAYDPKHDLVLHQGSGMQVLRPAFGELGWEK